MTQCNTGLHAVYLTNLAPSLISANSVRDSAWRCGKHLNTGRMDYIHTCAIVHACDLLIQQSALKMKNRKILHHNGILIAREVSSVWKSSPRLDLRAGWQQSRTA